MTDFTLDDAQRKILYSIMDQVIPASADGHIPAAGSLGVADFLGREASADPDLEKLFQHGLARAAELVDAGSNDVNAALVAQLEREEPAFFEALLRHTYMGYYSRPEVRALFGLSPKPTQPDGYDVPPDDPDELTALLDPVKQRGRCYRVA